MSPNPAPLPPAPLLVLGRPNAVSQFTLRRVFRAKEVGQPVIVVDYLGRLAAALTDRTKGNFHKAPLLWIDLANRPYPSALCRFTQSPEMKIVLRGLLEKIMRQLVVQQVSDASLDAVVEMAYRLAEQGSIGLAAIVTCLRRPEISHMLCCDPSIGADVGKIADALTWILRFPSVWAISEGNNIVNLTRHLDMGGTVWIEMQKQHFEIIEHRIVAWMVDAAVTLALLTRKPTKANGQPRQQAPVVVYGFPQDCPQPFAAYTAHAKHIGVFAFSSDQALQPHARPWLDANCDLWVAGSVGVLPASAKATWLTEAERLRLQQLEPGQVWVRSGVTKKAVTTLVRPPEPDFSLAQHIRQQAAKRLRRATIKQFSNALLRLHGALPPNADLYSKVATRDALYAAWLRVKSHNRLSYGSDRISVEDFGSRVDQEINQLLQELQEGRYRCRALRTTRIPKADGDFRVLRVPSVRDRVVQAACLHAIEPLFEPRFSTSSFGYRPGLGPHHAIAKLRSMIRSGKLWAVIADIRKCFDTIDHEIVLRLLGEVIGDADLLHLIRHWLAADIIDFGDVIPTELGVAQGEAISPLLANIYLDPLDKEFERSGFTFVRYADDYVVLCDSEAQAQSALRLMAEFLQGTLRMTLKPAKTHYCKVETGISFLGFEIGVTDACIPSARLTATQRSIEVLIDIMASGTPLDQHNAFVGANARIRGTSNYFWIDDAQSIQAQLLKLDSAIDEVAAQRLPKGSAMEAAWRMRDRFLPDMSNAARQLQTAAEVALITGAYPTFGASTRLPHLPGMTVPSTVSSADVPVADANLLKSADSKAAEEADVLVVDGRLHVMSNGCYVTVSADDVVIKKRKKEIFRSPIANLRMAYLEGKGIAVSADLTMRLCENDVPVVFTPLIGVPGAIAQPVQSMRSNVRQQQVLRRNDPEIVRIGLDMLSAKVANQASLARYFGKYRQRTNEAVFIQLTGCADEIRGIAETLSGIDPTAVGVRATAMGHEGRAAARYWAAFATLVPEELKFPGRHTRHATDAVNSAINYVYGILYGEVWRAIVRAGLDPYFGIVHGTERDQGSLVFDVIEEYRAPFGDRVVLSLLGRGFQLVLDKDGRIKASCRHKLVAAFHKMWDRPMRWRGKTRTPGEILEMQVTSLKGCFLGKGEYLAFRFRW